ncbi:restriction endonuclease subunit S [Staphylococcus aureus]|uniref:restriction endonuclease subunit S n=1 Tax=Staphylococcus aureus TaxID=1280 RepID=UPI002DBB84FE|nr:restriction endonuclease subunit S [Staphylococcus aureus]MEB6799527.1 restriction endonuclease subunit S [Staphylococcus aureus]MEB6814833.1 restriction endonuclease subunit S [Staphylococcus aureus]
MSNAQKKNVPELRFSGFEDEWEEKKLGNLGLFQKSYSFSRAKEGNGKTKHIHYGDIHSKFKTVLDSDGNIPNIIEKAVFELIQKGDIVFADASEDYSDLGKAVMIDFKPNSLISGLHTHLFRPLNNAISNFLIFYTKTLSYKKFIRQQGTGISVLGISKKSLLNLNVLIPRSGQEQQKIGKFFSKLDRQIELEEQKLELLQQQKKGYMQKFFSQELRFKDENGEEYPEWEEKQLGEVAEIIGGGTPSTKNKLYWNGEINWFSPIEIGNKTYVYSSQKKITEEGLRKSSAKILPVGTILFTSRAGIGKTAILAKESTTNQGFQSIVPRKGVLDSYYVYTISNILKILAEKVSAGSTFSEISKKQMEQLNLNIPMIKEQKNISKFFSKFDNLIEIQERKLKLLKQQKQGLLQKMFI